MASMPSELRIQWPALNIRGTRSKLSFIYQGIHSLISLKVLTYVTVTTPPKLDFQHPFQFKMHIYAHCYNYRTNHYHNSHLHFSKNLL